MLAFPGPVENLEARFAARFGAAAAVAAGFGRAALVLALEAVEARGRDVLLPEFICSQVPEAVRRAGAQPVFYPVEPDLSIDATRFDAALSRDVVAAVAIHFFGRAPAELSALAQICRDRRVALIEDCAPALGGPAGHSGDFAVFSFTKSEWCYGGGILIGRDPAALERARRIRDASFASADKLCRLYGRLRRLDVAANRPRYANLAALAGRLVERASGTAGDNFYDTGRLDARMPEFAARRALRILAGLEDASARRRALAMLFRILLAGEPGTFLWADPAAECFGNAAFLPLQFGRTGAIAAVELAGKRGITLRLSWPAFQPVEKGQGSETLAMLARELAVLEIHPGLTAREAARIAGVIRELA